MSAHEIPQLSKIDRNILRIAAYELFWGDRLAPGIVINEAIEIAKKYSGEQSATFVNGILDSVRKDTARPARSPIETA